MEVAGSSRSQPPARVEPPPMEELSDSEERHNDPSLYELPPFPKDHPIQQLPPLLTPSDTNATYGHTYIDGVRFPAMVISGEPRIPLLMFKRTFTDVEYEEYSGSRAIDYWIMELNIYQHNAKPDQARELRALGNDLDQDSLAEFQMLTQTDAERILARCRVQSDDPPVIKKSASLKDAFFRIPVRHNMVGGYTQEGFLYPERKGGRCIQCTDCSKFFIAEHFVLHSHSDNQENIRTVHWGLSPDTWRYALYLDEDTEKDEEMAAAFDKFCFGDGFYEEDSYYPPWFSKKPPPQEPSSKKKREEPEELVQLSPELVAILEGVIDMPKISHTVLEQQDQEMFEEREEKLRSKATEEAMSGKIFHMAGSAKGSSGSGVEDMDIQEQALQMFRSQQPHMPDPESFPRMALEHNGSQELLHMIETLKLLESTYPDGKPPPTARLLIDNLRNRLQQEAYQIQQHQLVYCTLLSAYKMLNLLWRTHADPSQPLPEAGDFAELTQKMMALDPMHFLGSPNPKPQHAVPPLPTEAELTSAATMKTPINLFELYAKLLKTFVTSPPLKMDSFPTFMTPLLTPEATLQSLMKLNGWSLNGLGASGSKLFEQPTKMPEMNGFKMPELNGLKVPEVSPLKMADLSSLKMPEMNGLKMSPNSMKLNNLLPSSLLMPQLLPLAGISPKALAVDGLSEEYNRLRNSLFNPLLLGLQTPQ